MENSKEPIVFKSAADAIGLLGVKKKEFEVKCELLTQICLFVTKSKLTQVQVSEILGTSQPRVCNLLRGRISQFSIDSLIGFMWKLGFEVSISATAPKIQTPKKPSTRKAAVTRV